MKKAKKEQKLSVDRRMLTTVPILVWWLADKLKKRHKNIQNEPELSKTKGAIDMKRDRKFELLKEPEKSLSNLLGTYTELALVFQEEKGKRQRRCRCL